MIHLDKKCIIAEMHSSTGEDALKEMVATVHQVYPQIDVTAALTVFMEREQIGSTGIGNGAAMPHGMVPNLDIPILCFGRSKKGISFDAVDNQPVYLFAGLFFPAIINYEYLKILAWTSQFFRNKANRIFLMETRNRDEIFEFLKAGGVQTEQQEKQ